MDMFLTALLGIVPNFMPDYNEIKGIISKIFRCFARNCHRVVIENVTIFNAKNYLTYIVNTANSHEPTASTPGLAYYDVNARNITLFYRNDTNREFTKNIKQYFRDACFYTITKHRFDNEIRQLFINNSDRAHLFESLHDKGIENFKGYVLGKKEEMKEELIKNSYIFTIENLPLILQERKCCEIIKEKADRLKLSGFVRQTDGVVAVYGIGDDTENKMNELKNDLSQTVLLGQEWTEKVGKENPQIRVEVIPGKITNGGYDELTRYSVYEKGFINIKLPQESYDDTWWKLTIVGMVQGVGCRPYITRTAMQLDLEGFVWNTRGCVEIYVKNVYDASKKEDRIDKFIKALSIDRPLEITRHSPTNMKLMEIFELRRARSDDSLYEALKGIYKKISEMGKGLSESTILEDSRGVYDIDTADRLANTQYKTGLTALRKELEGLCHEDDIKQLTDTKQKLDKLGSFGQHNKGLKDSSMIKFLTADTLTKPQREALYACSFDIPMGLTEDVDDRVKFLLPDIGTCPHCLVETASESKNDPRHNGYWFNSCAQCGPRYTVWTGFPYKREETTMGEHPACDKCIDEYKNQPDNRRFGAEIVSCNECTDIPSDYESKTSPLELFWHAAGGNTETIHHGTEAFNAAADVLEKGGIIAVKSLGGYHLMCCYEDKQAVKIIRQIKGHGGQDRAKPLAEMFLHMHDIKKVCVVSETEYELLNSPVKPIVLLRPIKGNELEERVKNGEDGGRIGALLPYTPLHYMLLKELQFRGKHPHIILTSMNAEADRLISDDEKAKKFVKDHAVIRGILYNNRKIARGIDDSVMQVFSDDQGKHYKQVIRFARGLVPYPFKIDLGNKNMLALGNDLKATFAFYAKDGYIMPGPYFGNLVAMHTENGKTGEDTERSIDNMWNYKSYIKEYRELIKLHDEKYVNKNMLPYAVVLSDLFKFSYVKRLTWELNNDNVNGWVEKVKSIQHHEAHIASVMAEHRLKGKVLGIAFDEDGYSGDDTSNEVWGGEFMLWDGGRFNRLAHFIPVNMHGFMKNLGGHFIATDNTLGVPPVKSKNDIYNAHGIMSDEAQGNEEELRPSTSVGRLFDAVASALDICDVNYYEGQAACKLQYAAENMNKTDEYQNDLNLSFDIEPDLQPHDNKDKNQSHFIINHKELFKNLKTYVEAHGLSNPGGDEKIKERKKNAAAHCFHVALADAIVNTALKIKNENKDLTAVALSGGVFQNTYLLELTFNKLIRADFDPYTNEHFPPNDGGLCIGQLWLGGQARS